MKEPISNPVDSNPITPICNEFESIMDDMQKLYLELEKLSEESKALRAEVDNYTQSLIDTGLGLFGSESHEDLLEINQAMISSQLAKDARSQAAADRRRK